jgi:hypothetical protein
MPVLDSLVWLEELVQIPAGSSPMQPSLFLLATPQSYYVFVLDGLTLCRAGESLKEVYVGLKDRRLHGNASETGMWPEEEWAVTTTDERHYFPVYTSIRNSDGTFDLVHDLKEFSEHNGLRIIPDYCEPGDEDSD